MTLETTHSLTKHHPLDRLTAAEIKLNRRIVADADLMSTHTRFTLVMPLEPPKDEVLQWEPGTPCDRRIRNILLDSAVGTVAEVIVSLGDETVLSHRTIDTALEGQPPIMAEEHELAERILWDHDGYRAAMQERGVADIHQVRIAALSAGDFGFESEKGHRIVRCLSFLQMDEDDNAFAHPIDGIVAYVDLISHQVTKLIDDEQFDIPADTANFHLPHNNPRETQRPIVISQPEGPSFSVEKDVINWEKWQVRIGFDQVEGLTLHQLGFHDGERLRPIIYRASVAEMVVPYGDPSPVRFWQNYFDAGEYSLGKETNSLELGCDCLGEIRYFDAVIADHDGNPRTINNAICLHEEDYGVLWKHTDMYNGSISTRRQRRLVISSFVTVGNYDYGFYWYLYLDGTIELETKATGVVFPSYFDPTDTAGMPPYASEVSKNVGAPYHQHLFSARLDVMLDGTHNSVDELQVQQLPISDSNPYGNAFTKSETRLSTESNGMRVADNVKGRVWKISNTSVKNKLGASVAYTLHPEGLPVLQADPSSSIARRAAFTTKHLWVTAYDPEQRYPAGNLVNQNPGDKGIDCWVKADRCINDSDIVLWHTFGLTHYPRTEDWPIMPVDTSGFILKPFGFFDENPALDTASPVAQAETPRDPECSC